MILPLIVLAVCTVGLSIVFTPAWPWFEHYLMGETAPFAIGRLIQPMLFVSAILVAAGIALGWWMYQGATDSLERRLPGLFRFLENRMWLDELYDRTVLALARIAANFADWMDRHFWDGIVSSAAGASRVLGSAARSLDEHGINHGADEASARTRGFGSAIARRHSGQIHTYLGAIALGLLALLHLYGWLA